MVLPQAMAWVQYWFRVLSLKFCGKSKKICGDISQLSPAFCMYGNPLISWVIGIRLKEADSEASRCWDINFYRKKHRCFKSLATLTYLFHLHWGWPTPGRYSYLNWSTITPILQYETVTNGAVASFMFRWNIIHCFLKLWTWNMRLGMKGGTDELRYMSMSSD